MRDTRTLLARVDRLEQEVDARGRTLWSSPWTPQELVQALVGSSHFHEYHELLAKQCYAEDCGGEPLTDAERERMNELLYAALDEAFGDG
jgi:hypothetical protein